MFRRVVEASVLAANASVVESRSRRVVVADGLVGVGANNYSRVLFLMKYSRRRLTPQALGKADKFRQSRSLGSGKAASLA